jgi:hypothetical protein
MNNCACFSSLMPCRFLVSIHFASALRMSEAITLGPLRGFHPKPTFVGRGDHQVCANGRSKRRR